MQHGKALDALLGYPPYSREGASRVRGCFHNPDCDSHWIMVKPHLKQNYQFCVKIYADRSV
jgi:hypothetical protein